MINLSPANDKTYTISDQPLTWSLVGGITTTQVPPCGYSETFSSGLVPVFVTSTAGSTIDYSAYSRDLAFVGSYTISVISTLIGYNFSPARGAPTCNSSFLLTTQDPCELTKVSIVPSSVENLITFAGYSVSSKLQYTFNDTQS